jgi:polyisoprenoid-binding protein YceI
MAWKIDPAHSEINFSVRHMMISTVRGKFNKFTGTIDFNENDPIDSSVEVVIDAASIDTREEDRDNHLRSPDFLNVEKYPHITFKSTRIEQIDDDHAHIFGDLTIRDVTKEVMLNTEYAGMAKSPWGQYSAGFNATTKINRKDFGLNWNQALETGGVLVGDEIKIDIDLEAIRIEETEEAQPETEAAAD